MRGELDIQLRNSVLKEVDVDRLGPGRDPYRAAGFGEDGSECPCFLAAQVGYVRYLSFRLETGKPREPPFSNCGEAP